jgi:hypothetical protein
MDVSECMGATGGEVANDQNLRAPKSDRLMNIAMVSELAVALVKI